MTKTKSTTLALLVATSLAVGVAGAAALTHESINANALGTDSTVTYPFDKGSTAFRYAPSFTAPNEKGNHWEFVQVKFDAGNVNLQSAAYIGVQMRVDYGNPGLTVGLHENGDRFNTSTDGKAFYFLHENGTIQQMDVLYNALNFSAGMTGTLLMPKSSMSWQWNNNQSDLSKVDSFYYTASTEFNWGYKLSFGEVGYYTGDPAEGATMTKLVDLSNGERNKNKYYVDSTNPDCMTMPSEADKPQPVAPTLDEYPFRTGNGAYLWTADWAMPNVQDSAANWQTLRVKFDTATVDFSAAEHLVVQFKYESNTPGITFGLNNKDARYSVAPSSVDGEPAFFLYEGETESHKTANVTYGAVTASTASKMGAMIIPMTSMAWQSGTAANRSLSAIDTLTLTTNSQFNYNWEITVGEVGYLDGTGAFHKILDLTTDKTEKFSVTSDLATNKCTLTIRDTVPKELYTQLGDTSIDFNAHGRSASSFGIWNRWDPDHKDKDGKDAPIHEGADGTVEMTTDSYGYDAVKITPTTVPSGNDEYMATTLSNGGFSWAGKKGVSLWARNDSDVEITFNIEVDCKDSATGKSDRFNVQANNRFSLYDVRTGKSYIYMTRWTVTIPVGFEGWVRVPFSAFSKADWSTNGFDPSKFMQEGTTVSYLAVTIHAPTYTGKSFSVNMFGGYETEPSFNSVLKTTGSIYELMELENLELVDPVEPAAPTALSEIIDLVPAHKEEN